ncbi:head-tail connector protein [Hoeflea sp. CAU 1731]
MTLDNLKAHLNITDNNDDALLTSKLGAALEWMALYVGEDELGNPLVIEATLQLAATFYEQREAIGPTELQEVPFTVWELIEPFRVRSF